MNSSIEVIPIDTDVLIIGGGLAGCMAAIKASEYGVKIAIAEKSNTLSSGCAGTGIDHVWGYIPPIHEQMGCGPSTISWRITARGSRGAWSASRALDATSPYTLRTPTS